MKYQKDLFFYRVAYFLCFVSLAVLGSMELVKEFGNFQYIYFTLSLIPLSFTLNLRPTNVYTRFSAVMSLLGVFFYLMYELPFVASFFGYGGFIVLGIITIFFIISTISLFIGLITPIFKK